MSDSSIDVQLPDSLGESTEGGDNPGRLEQPYKPEAETSLDAETSLEAEASLEELRDLMFGQNVNERVDHRLASYRIDAQHMAEDLPEAVTLALAEALVTSIRPTVEKAINESVNREQEILAEALFPIIGPATRKAVTSAIKTLTDSLNQGIELSLSPKSFAWRLESWRTGRPFAEVVLLRTLLYQVEQVLLIHKETGLMLQDVVADTVTVQDPDLVSSMLTAIEDFVSDSFTTNQSNKSKSFLESVDFGELTLLIEDGPQAVLACSTRGVAPANLRRVMQETLEKVHRQYDSQLDSFSGDRAPFDSSDILLRACLLSQTKTQEGKEDKEKKRSPLFWIAGTLLLGLLVFTVFTAIDLFQWNNAINALEKEPGITVVRDRRRWFRGQVKGLRDPLARESGAVMEEAGFKKLKSVKFNFEKFLSLSPDLIESHASRSLESPDGITFSYQPETLTLVASGQASNEWIKKAKQFSSEQSRVAHVDTTGVAVFEEMQLNTLKSELENLQIPFRLGSSELDPSTKDILNQVSQSIQEITQLAEQLQQPILIYVDGHATVSGNYPWNVQLSQSRADLVMRKLIESGISAQYLKAEGIGVRSSVEQTAKSKDAQVSFRVESIQS